MPDPSPFGPLSPCPSIAIIGSGAVGSYYGARLAKAGHAVHFLMRGDFDAVARDGMTIRSCAGDFTLAPADIHLYRDAQSMPQVDWVIVALKTTSNDLFQPLIAPLLREGTGEATAILTLQNGLGNEERLAALFPGRPILGGMAFTCINRVGPGIIEHTAHGYIRLGEFGGGPGPFASTIAAKFNRAGVPCDVLTDLRYGRWEKLVWNFPFNGLSTLLDQTTDQLLATPQGEQLVREIMAEVIQSARGNGVSMDDALIETNIARTREMGAYRTSMHIDRQWDRPLEIEAILGEPTRSGGRAGAATPSMRMLYTLLSMVNGSGA